MKIMLVLGVVAGPFALLVLAQSFRRWKLAWDVLAVLAGWAFGIIASLAVYEILRDGTVFMTNVHGIFTNPLFLVSGSYLGVYGLYLLLGCVWTGWKRLRTTGD